MTFLNKIKTQIVDYYSGGVETKDIRKHLDTLVSEDRDYALKHLPKHMVEAERFEQLYQWLTDFDFIEAKVFHPHIKIQELIEDYDLALNYEVLLSGEQERVLRLIPGALQLSAHILDEDKTQLVEQLLGRLGYFDVPDIQKILEVAKQRKNSPWLRPLQIGHIQPVSAVAVTPNGKHLISGSYDTTLKVWDLHTREEVCTLIGRHSDVVFAVAVTPDGKHLISSSFDNTLKIWDWQSREEVCSLNGHSERVNSVAVTPDGKYVISGSYDKTLKVWDLQTREERYTLSGHTSLVNAVAVTPDGKYLISGSFDSTLKIWDLHTREEVCTLIGHSYQVEAVAITPDGKYMISSSSDFTLKVWNLQIRKVIATFTGEGGIKCFAVAPDGLTIVAGESSGRLHFLRLENVN